MRKIAVKIHNFEKFQKRIFLISSLFFLDSDLILGEFKCTREKKYIITDKVCDHAIDCKFGSDERFYQNQMSFIQSNKQCKKNLLTLTCQTINSEEQIYNKNFSDDMKTLILEGNVSFSNAIHSHSLSIVKISGNRNFQVDFFFQTYIFYQ